MTTGGGELGAVWVNVVPSMGGSQALLQQFQQLARDAAPDFAKTFSEGLAASMPRALESVGRSMVSGLTAGVGASAGPTLLSHLLPSEGAIRSHMSRLGGVGAKSYVDEYERGFKNLTPVIEDASARAIAASKALVETTRQMHGTIYEGFYGFSKETTAAGDQMMAAWSDKMKLGVGLTAAAVGVEFVRNVHKEIKAFEHVGEEAAHTLVGGFESVLAGKMPDLIAPFNVFEDAAKTSLTAPLQVLETFIPGMGLVKKAVEDIFPPLDALKNLFVPVMQDMLQIGDQYLGLQRKLAESTLNPEGLERFSGVVQQIMASGAVVNFEDVADSIGRLNANIAGLSTEKLKELVTTFAMAEELVGHIDETKFAGVINAFKIPPDEANQTMIMLANTARATGINVNELTSEMQRSGPAFRDLGYNAQQTAAFFGEMTREGEQGQRLILALMEADKKLNDEVAAGKFPNAKAAWQSLTDSVLAYENAGQHAAALNLLESHGISERVAPMLLEMLKAGKISADNLGDAIQGVNQDIAESVEKTKDLGQTFKVVGQQIGAALAPTGMALAGGLRDAGNHVTEWLKENQGKVAQWGADIAKAFLNVGTFMVVWFADILKNLSPLFEAMKAGILAVTLPLDTLAHGMSAVFGGGWTTLADALHDVNSGLMNFDIGEKLDKASAAIHSFAKDTLPKWNAGLQAPVDDLKMEEGFKKRGFKMWFEDDDPAKVKVKPQTKDGQDIKDSGDLVPPGETSLTFTPDPGWHRGQYFTAPTVPGFAFGGPTVQGNWVPGKDSIPAMLEVGEYVVRRDQAQKHRRELDAINYGYAGFDSGGEVDPGLRVIYSFLRGAAGGFGLNLPKEKSGKDRDSASALVPGAFQASTAVAPSAAHSGGVKQQAYDAMIAAGGKPSDFPAIDYIFQHESSWDVNAVNRTDINAQHGDPSQGLGQLISGNYRAAGVDPNTKDAFQQTFAAVKYMQSRYGGIQQAYQYWQGHQNYAEGGHVDSGGGSWYGSGDHKENKGLTTGNLFHHFSKGFSGGGPTCSECGGAHPTAFHGGGIAHFGQGGDVGGVSQVIWSDTEDPSVQAAHGDAGVGVLHGKVVSGGPGSAYSDETNANGQGFAGHHGHVHTTFNRDPFTGAPYNQVPAGSNIHGAGGDSGKFPDWVYRLGDMYGLTPMTYPTHQEWDGANHGIDWYPKGKQNADLSDRGYTHQDHATLSGFARDAMAVGTGQGTFGSSNPAIGGSGVQLTGWAGGSGAPQGAGSLPGGPAPTDGGGDGNTFNGGQFAPGSPIGPGGLIGPGYNPWTNPPPGLSPTKRDEYTHQYEVWQLGEARRHRDHDKAQGELTQATQDRADAEQDYNKVLADANTKRKILEKQVQEWMSKHPGTSESDAFAALDPQTAEALEKAYNKLKTAKEKEASASDAATQDQLDDQVGHPPPQPGKEGSQKGGPMEGIASQLGGGLVKGVFQELGFPDVFGKPFTQWGIWKLLMGGLGFGLNVANTYADRAMAGDGGPFAGAARGGPGFPGSLPGQFGAPLGTPPGPPPGSTLPPAPPSTAPPGTPSNPVTVQGAPNKPPVSTQPAKPPLPKAPLPVPKPPLPEPGQSGGGPSLGLPNLGPFGPGGGTFVGGGGLGAPFGVSGFDPNSLFGGGGGGGQSAGGNNFMTGAFGGDYVKKLLDKAPNFLVGMQDQKFRDKVLGGLGGGSPSSPNTMAGNMQNQGGQAERQPLSQGGSVNFTVNNTGATTEGQLTKPVTKIVQSMSTNPGAYSGSVFSQ